MHGKLIALVVGILTTGAAGAIVVGRPTSPQGTPAHVVKLRLTAGGQDVATLATPSGVMATVSMDGGETLGLTPVVRNDTVALTVTLKDPVTGEFRVVGQYSLERNKATDVHTERTPLEVEWLETTPAPPLATREVPAAPCSVCCVVCDGRAICACEVSTICGYCCCKETCGCTGERRASSVGGSDIGPVVFHPIG